MKIAPPAQIDPAVQESKARAQKRAEKYLVTFREEEEWLKANMPLQYFLEYEAQVMKHFRELQLDHLGTRRQWADGQRALQQFEQREPREVAELREGTWQWKAKQQSLAARAARAGKPGYTATGAKA